MANHSGINSAEKKKFLHINKTYNETREADENTFEAYFTRSFSFKLSCMMFLINSVSPPGHITSSAMPVLPLFGSFRLSVRDFFSGCKSSSLPKNGGLHMQKSNVFSLSNTPSKKVDSVTSLTMNIIVRVPDKSCRQNDRQQNTHLILTLLEN